MFISFLKILYMFERKWAFTVYCETAHSSAILYKYLETIGLVGK